MSDKSASGRKAKRDALTPSSCEIPGCEWTYNFQRHRIVPGRLGGKYKQGNVIALCPNHHSVADDDVIPAEYLLGIVSERIEKNGIKIEQRTPGLEERGGNPSEESVEGDGECATDAGDGLEQRQSSG